MSEIFTTWMKRESVIVIEMDGAFDDDGNCGFPCLKGKLFSTLKILHPILSCLKTQPKKKMYGEQSSEKTLSSE